LITIHDQTAVGTNMCTNTQRLFDDRATVGAFLTGIVRWDCNDRSVMQEAVSGKPLQEDPPASVMDRFGKLAVADHVTDLKVLIGNQVARRDERVCLFASKIFTLPLYLQMLLGQSFLCFFSIGRCLLFARETAPQPLEPLFSFAVVSWVINGIPLYTTISVHVKKGWDKCPKNESTSMSPSDKKNNWRSAVRRKTYPWQRLFGGLLMPIWLGMTQHIPLCPSPKKGRPIHPPLKRRGHIWGRVL